MTVPLNQPETTLRTVTCPHCGQLLQEPFQGVLTPDSQAMRDLLQGTLNCPKCPHCGKVFRLGGQLIYRDPDTAFILVQDEMPEDGDTEPLEQEVDCLATDAAMAHGLERPTVRLVFTREDFLEKIFLRRAGLDDRLIEYAKYQLHQWGAKDLLSAARFRLLYDFSNQSEENLSFIVFDRETLKPVNGLQVPRAEYDKLLAEFQNNPNLMKELETLFPGCFVHVDRLFDKA